MKLPELKASKGVARAANGMVLFEIVCGQPEFENNDYAAEIVRRCNAHEGLEAENMELKRVNRVIREEMIRKEDAAVRLYNQLDERHQASLAYRDKLLANNKRLWEALQNLYDRQTRAMTKAEALLVKEAP